jgi:hypothetical protein
MDAHTISIMPEEAFRWYFTGLADGEGCFHFRQAVAATRPHWRPPWQGTFTIAMRDDETSGLLAIRKRIGVGQVWTDDAACRAGRGNPQLRWEVRRVADLANVIIPHFVDYPLQMKKARDFAIWKRCVELWYASSLRKRKGRVTSDSRFGQRSSRLEDHEIELLLQWAQELRDGRKYRPPGLRFDRVAPRP